MTPLASRRTFLMRCSLKNFTANMKWKKFLEGNPWKSNIIPLVNVRHIWQWPLCISDRAFSNATLSNWRLTCYPLERRLWSAIRAPLCFFCVKNFKLCIACCKVLLERRSVISSIKRGVSGCNVLKSGFNFSCKYFLKKWKLYFFKTKLVWLMSWLSVL